MSDLQRVPRPDNEQDEQRLVKFGKHDCPRGSEHDYLLFPVGVYGSAFPMNTPFEVTAIQCEGCGAAITVWFEWYGAQVFDLGAK